MDQGVIYIAVGDKARSEANNSLVTLRQYHNWPVLVIGDRAIKGAQHRTSEERGTPGRWAKVWPYESSGPN